MYVHFHGLGHHCFHRFNLEQPVLPHNFRSSFSHMELKRRFRTSSESLHDYLFPFSVKVSYVSALAAQGIFSERGEGEGVNTTPWRFETSCPSASQQDHSQNVAKSVQVNGTKGNKVAYGCNERS